MMRTLSTILLLAAITATPLLAAERSGFELTVLVDDEPRKEYFARGTTYVEALAGRSYTLRVTNPFPHRVAVALSVDGLNTIDAKHTAASRASKWVIEPYDSIVISGWQVSDNAARQFFFTSENRSYGAALGETDNLGVIEAVFFREREPAHYHREYIDEDSSKRSKPHHGAPAPSAAAGSYEGKASAPPSDLSDDYAATGMGDRRDHAVTRVDLDLDPKPAARVKLRYEFRRQLVEMGVIRPGRSPIERREQARGFERYSPEVD